MLSCDAHAQHEKVQPCHSPWLDTSSPHFQRSLTADCPLHLPALLNGGGYGSRVQEQSLDFHMFLASPDGEKALCPCCLPLGEVFWGALPVPVLRVALTHIVNHFLLGGGRVGGVWVGHSLEGLGATKGSSGETRQVTAAAVQCPHLTFPPPGERGDLVTFLTHFSVGNSHGSAKYHMQTASYIPSNISEDWTVNQWWFSSHR